MSLARKMIAWPLVALVSVWLQGCSSTKRPAVSPFDEDVTVTSLAILPVPSRDLPAARQDAILSDLAEALGKRYKIPVITGLTLGRAVFGSLASDRGECVRAFSETLKEAKESQKRLQLNKALGLLGEAGKLLPTCGAEIKDPGQLTDVYLTMGLMLVTLERTEEAEAAFRQLVALDNKYEASLDLFRTDQMECFERAQRQLLSGNAFQVEVLSWPEGATVFIDGRRAGEAPLQIPLFLGRHFVRIELKGHAPFELNIPDDAPPASIRAWLFPFWPHEDPPEELMEEFTEGEAFSDRAYQQLAKVASTYKVDAVLITQFGMSGKNVQLAARMYIAQSDRVVREGSYNLGDDPKTHQARIEHLVRIFSELKKQKKKKKPKKPAVKKPEKKPVEEPEKKAEPKKPPKEEPAPKPKPKKRKKQKYKKPPVEEVPG